MRLTRVYVDTALSTGQSLALQNDTAAHVAKVLRARVGDQLIMFNGDGREFSAAIESVRGSRVAVIVGEGAPLDRESPLGITLVQSVPRGDRMDLVVQKATELGVARIVPVLSQRSVVRLDKMQAESKVQHWQAVAVSACEQCGRNRLPVIEAAQPLLNYLGDSVASGPRWVLEPDTEALAQMPHSIAGPVEIAIGPEGGFAPEELEGFRVAGFSRVGLGPRILRAETAAIAALAWLQTRYGDMR
jgi:16S rRNA (uracil1498-N3)-methyltransferase